MPIPATLSCPAMGLAFDPATGRLLRLCDERLGWTGEISETTPRLVTPDGIADFAAAAPENVVCDTFGWTADYRIPRWTARVTWRLCPEAACAFQRWSFTPDHDAVLERVEHASWKLDGDVRVYRYPCFDELSARHPDSPRPRGFEPARTFFARRAEGGTFAGLAMSFGDEAFSDGRAVLAYAPRLRLQSGETLAGETAYLGVYAIGAGDGDDAPPPTGTCLGEAPLPSESEALVRVADALLGPPRHGLTVYVNGWHAQMEHGAYSEASLADDMAFLELPRELGVDGVTDSHPWSGDHVAVQELADGERYLLGDMGRRYYTRLRELGLKSIHWSTITHAHPWRLPEGKPFRPDRPDWRRTPSTDVPADEARWRQAEGNCYGHKPFSDWQEELILSALAQTGSEGWCPDGDFFGSDGFFISTVPVDCHAEGHTHLPGDSQYANVKAQERLLAAIRRRFPSCYINVCRPIEDLSVWDNRNVDACFTVIETGTSPDSHLDGGDEVRRAARVRRRLHFFPHWLDWSLIFPSPEVWTVHMTTGYRWPSAHLDYIMLSALAATPNILMYLPRPVLHVLPEADRAAIRYWLDWGRRRETLLLAPRHDLRDWPGPGALDGMVHSTGREALAFLFNPNADDGEIAFTLDGRIGWSDGPAWVSLEYQTPDATKVGAAAPHMIPIDGEIRWRVPARGVVVLSLSGVK